MRKFWVYTTWGGEFGIAVDKTLEQLVVEARKNGYICTRACFVMWSAIAGIEDVELSAALREAAEQGTWQ